MTAPAHVQFHLLSFEGPDPYSYAGGLGSRITGLTAALADEVFETHLWFIGDPAAPPVETFDRRSLHRWCQWISRFHTGGVYDGEEGKRNDYCASLPPVLVRDHLLPHLSSAPSNRAVVLAEEWHTADAVLHLDWLLRQARIRQQVAILWNANNVFGFDRIDWKRLAAAATITTVSRFMKHQMWAFGIDPVVVPNGLSGDAFRAPRRGVVSQLRHLMRGRTLLAKIARWDPDKRWLQAIRITAEMKRYGFKPLLVARGGVEQHGTEVMREADACGLRVIERDAPSDTQRLLEILRDVGRADVVSFVSPLSGESQRILFRAADTVLAQSGREPFGLVALEAMAVAGLACTGCTGEDYAVAGKNAIVLQTADPGEFVGLYREVAADPVRQRAMRRSAKSTARDYHWTRVIRSSLLPRLRLLAA